MRMQKTLKRNIDFDGVGLHSGHSCQVTLKPAPEDTGLVFLAKKASSNQFIPYNGENIVDTQNNISISNGKAVIKTVEHLVSALYASQIDNCIIECGSNEVPILDGSAKFFIEGIVEAGTVEQTRGREEFRIINPIWSTLDDKFIVALPFNGFKINYTISFPDSPIGTQTMNLDISKENFIKEISGARTFGFIEDLEEYHRSGLVMGVNLDNVQVYSKRGNRVLNSSRYEDEPVRHKILDLIGSLALLNFDIKGFIISYKGGHTLDVSFARKVMNIFTGSGRFPNDSYYHNSPSYFYQADNLLDIIKMPS
jgi:UDP-3-O-[3-hydroxymyristoyl] N-acetylglucosamine deacetylase